jgi:hypothetical protein
MESTGEGPKADSSTETRHETSEDRAARAPDSPGGGQENVDRDPLGPDSPGGGQEDVEGQLRRDPVSPGGGQERVGRARRPPDSPGGGQDGPVPDSGGRQSA